MNCRKASEISSQSLDTEVNLFRRIGMYYHFVLCSVCYQYHRKIRLLRVIIRSYHKKLFCGEIKPCFLLSDDARARLKRVIDSEYRS